MFRDTILAKQCLFTAKKIFFSSNCSKLFDEFLPFRVIWKQSPETIQAISKTIVATITTSVDLIRLNFITPQKLISVREKEKTIKQNFIFFTDLN